MKRTEVQTKSGLTGWQGRLQDHYNLFSEFEGFDETYGLAGRLGFSSAREAWEANPIVQGSTNPDDYCRVLELKDQPIMVKVIVELQIESPHDEPDNVMPMWMITHAAEQAVENALKMGHNHGFDHDFDADVCIGVVSVGTE